MQSHALQQHARARRAARELHIRRMRLLWLGSSRHLLSPNAAGPDALRPDASPAQSRTTFACDSIPFFAWHLPSEMSDLQTLTTHMLSVGAVPSPLRRTPSRLPRTDPLQHLRPHARPALRRDRPRAHVNLRVQRAIHGSCAISRVRCARLHGVVGAFEHLAQVRVVGNQPVKTRSPAARAFAGQERRRRSATHRSRKILPAQAVANPLRAVLFSAPE